MLARIACALLLASILSMSTAAPLDDDAQSVLDRVIDSCDRLASSLARLSGPSETAAKVWQAEPEARWFREGLDRYLVWRAAVESDLLDVETAERWLCRQVTAHLDGLAGKTSLVEAGQLCRRDERFAKAAFLTVLALDHELRQSGGPLLGIEALADALSGLGRRYTNRDLLMLAESLTGGEFETFFKAFVGGSELQPLLELLTQTGLSADLSLLDEQSSR